MKRINVTIYVIHKHVLYRVKYKNILHYYINFAETFIICSLTIKTQFPLCRKFHNIVYYIN